MSSLQAHLQYTIAITVEEEGKDNLLNVDISIKILWRTGATAAP